jgi:hypothetical protein
LTAELGPSQADLIALLDKDRNYGDRTYDDVVREVIDGSLLLEPGHNLPVIKDARTRLAVKGSGRYVGTTGPQQEALAAFRRMALDDVPDAYAELRSGMKNGDPRFHKIYWENLIGKVGETRGGDEMAKAMQMLVAHFEKPETRTVIIDG